MSHPVEGASRALSGFARGASGDDKRGGRGRNRTVNPRIKSPMLCQLSYAPYTRSAPHKPTRSAGHMRRERRGVAPRAAKIKRGRATIASDGAAPKRAPGRSRGGFAQRPQTPAGARGAGRRPSACQRSRAAFREKRPSAARNRAQMGRPRPDECEWRGPARNTSPIASSADCAAWGCRRGSSRCGRHRRRGRRPG